MIDGRVSSQEVALEMAYAEKPMRDELLRPGLETWRRAHLERSARRAGTLAARNHLQLLDMSTRYGKAPAEQPNFEGLSLEDRFQVGVETLINSYPIKMNLLKQLPRQLTPRNILTARDVLVFGKSRLLSETYRVGEKSLRVLDDGINRLFEGRFQWKEFPALQDIATYCSDVSQVSACVLPVKTYGTWHKSEPSVQALIDMSDDDLAYRLRIATPATSQKLFGGEPDYSRISEVRQSAIQFTQDFLEAKQAQEPIS